jgi:hypothetical protein
VVVQLELQPHTSIRRHPERSRFSGGARDLPLLRPNAYAKLHHYQPFSNHDVRDRTDDNLALCQRIPM